MTFGKHFENICFFRKLGEGAPTSSLGEEVELPWSVSDCIVTEKSTLKRELELRRIAVLPASIELFRSLGSF